ncbi:MAG: hypothetical protein RSC43_01115 [Clostridia bacterium]
MNNTHADKKSTASGIQAQQVRIQLCLDEIRAGNLTQEVLESCLAIVQKAYRSCVTRTEMIVLHDEVVSLIKSAYDYKVVCIPAYDQLLRQNAEAYEHAEVDSAKLKDASHILYECDVIDDTFSRQDYAPLLAYSIHDVHATYKMAQDYTSYLKGNHDAENFMTKVCAEYQQYMEKDSYSSLNRLLETLAFMVGMRILSTESGRALLKSLQERSKSWLGDFIALTNKDKPRIQEKTRKF